MDNLTIVKIGLDDIAELKEISEQTYFDTFSGSNTVEDMLLYLKESFNEKKLREELSEPNSEFFFAKVEDNAVAYMKINVGSAQTEFNDENSLELERLYVLKEYKGKRIGQTLMNKAFEIAKNTHKEFIWLGVWEKNFNAQKFYKKNGFEITGSHPFKMGNDIQTDFIMKLYLK